jgi:thiosulfate dehydrogenase [quinone] large subunit
MATQRFLELPSWVVLAQLFIGLGWMRAAAEKVIEPDWWSGDVVEQFVLRNEAQTLGWFEPVTTFMVLPNLVIVSLLVLLAQLGAGLSLLTGRYLGVGLTVGVFLNLTFVAAGAVDPSAFYLIIQAALFLWLIERRGADSDGSLLSAVQVVAATVAAISVPYITTIQPAEVIHDPAVMFSFLGVLTVFVCELSRRRMAAPWSEGSAWH